jgi:hypothetical protein
MASLPYPFNTATQSTTNSEKVIKTDLLKVEGKTMVFGNTIYQIPNISQVSVIDLTTTKAIPWYFWVLLVIGFGFLITEYFLFAILSFGIAGMIFYFYTKNLRNEKYGLQIVLNAGLVTVLVSDYMDFLVTVAITLVNIMNEVEERSITFNFDQRKIVENTSGSTVVMGNVKGSVVSNVS